MQDFLWFGCAESRAGPSSGINIQARSLHSTSAGSWKYLEYPEINMAGLYLYEPAGSVHTLHFPDTNTEITDVSFVLHGANLNLDDEGNVESVLDASAALPVYCAGCRDAGLPHPNVIGA